MKHLRALGGAVAAALVCLAPPSAWGFDPMLEFFKQGYGQYTFYGRVRPNHLDIQYIELLKQDQDWKELALYVLDYGYPLDVSDYYLGVAAEGMGLLATADIYYTRAYYGASFDRGRSCQRENFDVCHGLLFPEDAWKARQRILLKIRSQ